MRVFAIVVAAAVSICFCVYTLTGVFGYLTFYRKECIESDILRNYSPKDVMVDVARAMLGLVVVTSYPILTFCGRFVSSAHTHTHFFLLFSVVLVTVTLLSFSRSQYVYIASSPGHSRPEKVGVAWGRG